VSPRDVIRAAVHVLMLRLVLEGLGEAPRRLLFADLDDDFDGRGLA
jgi:hypothetical protein